MSLTVSDEGSRAEPFPERIDTSAAPTRLSAQRVSPHARDAQHCQTDHVDPAGRIFKDRDVQCLFIIDGDDGTKIDKGAAD
jgi:hypothetical protein